MRVATSQDSPATPSFESTPDSNRLNDQRESVEQAISRLAYGYWLERQGTDQGSAEEDWFRAEREWRARESARA